MTAEANTARPRKERAENAARRRRQIIEATIDSITRHGLSGTTLATVAAEAGLSQGSAVFYFKTKEDLFAATLRAHYDEYAVAWRAVYERDYADPVEHLVDFVLVDLSAEICSRRNLTLWYSFWGEARARPRFAEIAEEGDRDRLRHLQELAQRASSLMARDLWSVEAFAGAVDALTDGLWMQQHMSGDLVVGDARRILCQFVASVFPSRREMVLAKAGGRHGG